MHIPTFIWSLQSSRGLGVPVSYRLSLAVTAARVQSCLNEYQRAETGLTGRRALRVGLWGMSVAYVEVKGGSGATRWRRCRSQSEWARCVDSVN